MMSDEEKLTGAFGPAGVRGSTDCRLLPEDAMTTSDNGEGCGAAWDWSVELVLSLAHECFKIPLVTVHGKGTEHLPYLRVL